ncbi:hypothetical protein ID859_18585 [Xenorhabdus sp. 38]|nr:hypothetical protein [Xenorhabdus sp. 38]
MSLADARAKREEAKKLMPQCLDPKSEKRGATLPAKVSTFEQVARAWHASNKRWSDSHRKILPSSRPAP